MKGERIVTCKNRKTGETQQVSSDLLRFRPSVYGILLKDRQVLLSPQWGDGYDLPGGGVDLGESVAEALVREFSEETGISIEPDSLLHLTEDFFISNFKPGLYFHSLLYFYTCKNPKGEISSAGFEEYEKGYMQEARWIPLTEIDSLKFYSPVDVPALIRMAASGKTV